MVFHVKTDASSPPGELKNLFCQVVITQDGEPIVHNLGTGRLRIDKPLPRGEDRVDRGEKQDHRHGLLALREVQAPEPPRKTPAREQGKAEALIPEAQRGETIPGPATAQSHGG